MIKRFCCIWLCCILPLLFGCTAPQTPDTEKLQIVTTNFPAYDFARQITGDIAEVTMLMSPGEESHTFEPTPQDMIVLTKADIFILGGGESDQWALHVMDSAEIASDKALFMMECVETVPALTEDAAPHQHGAQHSHDHKEFYAYDEHVWTSPENAMDICKAIAEKCAEADPEHKEVYTENLSQYLQELSLLDTSFREVVDGGFRKTLVFADRFPFRYFADCYGLTYYSAFPGCADETEPDAATMKFLIDTIQKDSIPVVCYTELSNRKIADALSEATGVKQVLFHSCHNVTKDEFQRGETYVSLMKQNVAALKEALN